MHHRISKLLLLSTVFIILILGAYLRLYKIGDYLTFLGDEGRDVLVVKRMIVDHDLVFLGPTASVGGFFLGPMYYYFMAPFLYLYKLDPVGPAVMVALFGVLTIYLVYYVGKKMFHTGVGVIASLLYALSPVVIAYSRSSWNPNLVPFFSLLLILFLWRFYTNKRIQDLVVIGIIWGFGIQFHYLFSFLILFSLLWILFIRRSIHVVKDIIILGFSSLIPLLPFVLFEIRHGFPNTRSLINFFATGKETGFVLSSFLSTVSDVVFRSFGRLVYRMPNYEMWNGFPDEHINLLVFIIRATLYGVFGFGLACLLWQSKKKKKLKTDLLKRFFPTDPSAMKGLAILFTWYIFSVLLFGLYRKGIYDYYFGIFFAFPFLSISVVLWYVLQGKARIILIMATVALAYYNWMGRPFIYPPNRQLDQTRRIAEAAILMTQDQPYNFALDTATNSDHAYRYFFEIWNKKPTIIEQPAIDPERKTVKDQLIVICENPSCKPLGAQQWEIAGFGRAEITEEKDIFPVKLVKLKHYTPNETN